MNVGFSFDENHIVFITDEAVDEAANIEHFWLTYTSYWFILAGFVRKTVISNTIIIVFVQKFSLNYN